MFQVDQSRFRAAADLPPDQCLRAIGGPTYLIIDEAQRLPETARISKGWYDVRLQVRSSFLVHPLSTLDQAAESLTAATANNPPPLCIGKRWSPDGAESPTQQLQNTRFAAPLPY